MALPVIATNWSGPTAYLDETVGYPLPIEGLVDSGDAEGAFKGAPPRCRSRPGSRLGRLPLGCPHTCMCLPSPPAAQASAGRSPRWMSWCGSCGTWRRTGRRPRRGGGRPGGEWPSATRRGAWRRRWLRSWPASRRCCWMEADSLRLPACELREESVSLRRDGGQRAERRKRAERPAICRRQSDQAMFTPCPTRRTPDY